jgi:hypothetical protein
MYDVFTEDWLKIFPRDQMYFSKLEEFSADRRSSLQKMFQFIAVGKWSGHHQHHPGNHYNNLSVWGAS